MQPPALITALHPPKSPARVYPPERALFRIGLVQQRWHPDPEEHEWALADGIRVAAALRLGTCTTHSVRPELFDRVLLVDSFPIDRLDRQVVLGVAAPKPRVAP